MDHRSCRDRYASAVSTSDLTPRARSTMAPLDVLGAAGLAARHQPLGMLLQRLRAAPTLASQAEAQEALAEKLREAVRRRQVRREGMDSERIAADALAWWLDPTCLTCGGVRYQAQNGRLTVRDCPACRGTGKRPLASEAHAAAEWLVDAISQQVAQSEAAHRRALR